MPKIIVINRKFYYTERRNVWKTQRSNGIPHLMQLVLPHELSKEEYYWLSHLRDNLKAGREIEDLARHYGPNKHSELHQAVMNVIIRANKTEMEAERDMCDALYELFEDELKEREARGEARGETQGIIKSLIETCADFGASRSETLERLMNRLPLTPDIAEDYMKKYWK